MRRGGYLSCGRAARFLPAVCIALLGLLAALLAASSASLAETQARHAIAMHGEPALPPDFTHFRYVNPAAPKGGRLVQGVLGTFDSLNPFIVQGPRRRSRSAATWSRA